MYCFAIVAHRCRAFHRNVGNVVIRSIQKVGSDWFTGRRSSCIRRGREWRSEAGRGGSTQLAEREEGQVHSSQLGGEGKSGVSPPLDSNRGTR